jgi:transcriptional regulator with XRE-family HTH domain
MPVRHANPRVNGDRLRQIRIGLGWSITQAGEKSGVNRSYLGQLETGARLTTSPGTLKQICAAYGIPMSDVLLGDGTPTAAAEVPTGRVEFGNRLLLTLQEVAEMTGFSYRRLADDCRAEPTRLEHVHRDGRRFMTEQQVAALIQKYTRKASRVPRQQDPDERDRRRAEKFTGRAA